MDITRRCDYACRMLRAVSQANGERISVSDISKAEGIPYSFARSIQHDLVKAGFLSTVRGAPLLLREEQLLRLPSRLARRRPSPRGLPRLFHALRPVLRRGQRGT